MLARARRLLRLLLPESLALLLVASVPLVELADPLPVAEPALLAPVPRVELEPVVPAVEPLVPALLPMLEPEAAPLLD